MCEYNGYRVPEPDAWHEATHEAWHNDKCDLHADGWPYECDAQDNPRNFPITCRAHNVWWCVYLTDPAGEVHRD